MKKTSKKFNTMSRVILILGIISIIFIMSAVIANAGTVNISNTIVVAAGETYDGGGDTIIASGMGDGSQDEDQDPIFRLEDGATLKNVVIGAPGCDGVHCYGDVTVDNVIWEDIGEDALTIKDEGDVSISNCKFYNGDDKVLQVNAASTMTVTNCYADTAGKFIRQNGDTTFKCTWNLIGTTVKNMGECVARTDSSTTTLTYDKDCVFSGVDTLWVFPSSSQISGDETTGDETTGDETTGDETTSDETTSDETTGDETTGDETTSDETTSDETTSDETSDETTGGETSDETTGYETIGDETTADEISDERTGEELSDETIYDDSLDEIRVRDSLGGKAKHIH
ncbi:MAG: pectate lyase [Clostridiales bacterium]